MARSPRNLNPEGSGKGSLSMGQSGQNARATANLRAGAGNASRNQMTAYRSAAAQRATAIARYGNVKSVTSTNYTLPFGIPLIAGAALLGSTAAKNRAKQAAIKKASVKTRKGQSRGR